MKLPRLLAPFSRHVDERRPSLALLGLEWRAPVEWAAAAVATPWLLRATPKGDGHTVLVLPGLLGSDVSTAPLRAFLRGLGYRTTGWHQGRNLGPRQGLADRLRHRLEALHEEAGAISVIGWSLGGVFARELARARPRLVRQVITLGSPLYGAPKTSTNAWAVYCIVNKEHRVDEHVRGTHPPPVPCTSIYSRGDGVVAWGTSVEHRGLHTDSIEINAASHLGLGINPLAWYAIGDRLAQPAQAWQPFRPRGVTRLAFPFNSPERERPAASPSL